MSQKYGMAPARVRVYASSEHNEQVALFQWAALHAGRYPELGLLFAVPNGGKRDKLVAMQLQREGVKPGVPDLCLPVPSAGWHGLFIELKWGRNTTTDKQNEWLERLREQGYLAVVCYGWCEAVEVIREYSGMEAQ